jgi:hypothetical protein
MADLESQEEDAPKRILFFNPMSWLGQIRPQVQRKQAQQRHVRVQNPGHVLHPIWQKSSKLEVEMQQQQLEQTEMKRVQQTEIKKVLLG